MCKATDSIDKVNQAADELLTACLSICNDDLSQTLRAIYDPVLAEGVKPEEQRLLDKLQ